MHTLFCTAAHTCSLGSTTLPSITHLISSPRACIVLFFSRSPTKITIQFSLVSSDAHPPTYPGSLMTDLSLHKLLQRCHNPKWRHLGCASTTFLWARVVSGCAAQLRLPSLRRWHVWPRSAWCLALWQAHWIFSSVCRGVRVQTSVPSSNMLNLHSVFIASVFNLDVEKFECFCTFCYVLIDTIHWTERPSDVPCILVLAWVCLMHVFDFDPGDILVWAEYRSVFPCRRRIDTDRRGRWVK